MEPENPTKITKPLSECNPLWITHRDRNVGIMLKCPLSVCKCGGAFLTWFWSHPSRSPRNVTGDSFENLTFETDLDGKKYGCSFHGKLVDGILTWES
jgi:hypothetical protein